MIDAQPGDGWIVPTAVASALLGDTRAGDEAMAAAERVWGQRPLAGRPALEPWLTAARNGPADARLAQAARDCFGAARAALARHNTPAPILAAVDDFIERYVSNGRCPADDLLEAVR